jgi:hypothetical protein
MFPNVLAETVTSIENGGASVELDALTDVLTVNGEFTASIVIARCARTSGGFRWKVRLDTGLRPDVTVAIRMDEVNEAVLDYYLLPSIDMNKDRLKLAETNGLSLDAYRFETLAPLFRLSARNEIGVFA